MKKSRNGRGVALKAAALALCIALIAGGTAVYEQRRRAGEEKRAREYAAERASVWTTENTVYLNDTLYGFDHRLEKYLFIGTDLTGSGTEAGEGYVGSMADFLLLMVLDYTDDTCGCIQIDRNTITQVNMIGRDGSFVGANDFQICTAHWYGGSPEQSAQNTVDAVCRYLGDLYDIDGYFVMSMHDIAVLNSAVGGVTVSITEDLTAADPAFTEGASITLDDVQAEHFVRARMALANDSNIARMGRQRQYMEGVLSQVRRKTASNPKYGADLWKMLKENSFSNMNGNDFSRIAEMYLHGEDRGILQIEGSTQFGKRLEDGEVHEEFIPDPASVEKVMCTLFSLVPADEEQEEAE